MSPVVNADHARLSLSLHSHSKEVQDIDVLIIGAGFAGIFMLHELRKQGYMVVIYDAASKIGGTWRSNTYPGARVDSETPVYELSFPEIWQTWNWSCNYPDWQEIQRYFDHVDAVLDVSKHCVFNTLVTSAEFCEREARWTIVTSTGRVAKARFLIGAVGFAAKAYTPEIRGLDSFKGRIYHSSAWPKEGVEVDGKRCAVIGTGASGVQIAQQWGSENVDTLTVFQRTPNLALPMAKKDITVMDQEKLKEWYPGMFHHRENCYGGLTFDVDERGTFEVSEGERLAKYEYLWGKGGLCFWIGNFNDILTCPKANRAAYSFWATKQRARISDARKRDLLCPLEPKHAFGIKRPSLESTFYDMFNRPNIDIVDVSNGNDIEFVETGIRTKGDGKVYEVNIVAMATGFDVTGSLTSTGIKNTQGIPLATEWASSATSYLGIMIPKYSNFFYLYGPHGPIFLANGPSCIEVQGRWIRDVINKIQMQGIRYIDPTPEAGDEWKRRLKELGDETLFSTIEGASTYMGTNVAGRRAEYVNYVGGMRKYKEEIRSKIAKGWDGFRVEYGDEKARM
ncbi:Baeyer-Villiger monooxygenase [Pseudocercospora fuligena]|uniref:Baeyer-Villiger monooxygenase n=1 Tax=Pseudocercospora fuligena TaxID=685502 RepID=A0A8H6R767_9PEZI|nr:Baeyer-Villiger monooxygenase [Pseudocercospora fuligena]